MRYQVPVMVLALWSGAAGAQSAAPGQLSDTWARPASAGTAAYAGAAHPGADGGKDVFKFKDSRPRLPASPNAGNNPSGQAQVSGDRPQIGADGRPTLNCMRSPMDSQCR